MLSRYAETERLFIREAMTIDLANMASCPFTATQDLGRVSADGSFEVLRPFDFSDLRGCNLLVVE